MSGTTARRGSGSRGSGLGSALAWADGPDCIGLFARSTVSLRYYNHMSSTALRLRESGYQDGSGLVPMMRVEARVRPERSHYFQKRAFGNFGETYRDGFLRGYREGFGGYAHARIIEGSRDGSRGILFRTDSSLKKMNVTRKSVGTRHLRKSRLQRRWRKIFHPYLRYFGDDGRCMLDGFECLG